MRVQNPFALRESLQVALEVAWSDMPADELFGLRRFTREIPSCVSPTALKVGTMDRDGLLTCTAHFRQSRTWFWLREDLCEALCELERELRGTLT